MHNYKYKIKTIMLESGERFPVIIKETDEPDFYSTAYSVSILRARNLASNTMENTLRSILILNLFIDSRCINLESRFSSGLIFTIDELNSLIILCRQPASVISAKKTPPIKNKNSTRRISFEEFRRKMRESSPEISNQLLATRLIYMCAYLRWRIEFHLSHAGMSHSIRSQLISAKDSAIQHIKAMSPKSNNHGGFMEREGLSTEEFQELLRVVDPTSKDNPWHNEFIRIRNQLLVLWLCHFGIRKGELLNICVQDINFRENKVQIIRRADNPEDPRVKQPKVKTLDRELSESFGVLDKTYDYLTKYRSQIPLTRKHDFLFVSLTGRPLSSDGCAKIFFDLRNQSSKLPKNLSPHSLRHTWNTRFSELMDERKVDAETENRIRSYVMGWKETSKTASVYTRRHIRKKAQEAALAMQRKMLEGDDNE